MGLQAVSMFVGGEGGERTPLLGNGFQQGIYDVHRLATNSLFPQKICTKPNPLQDPNCRPLIQSFNRFGVYWVDPGLVHFFLNENKVKTINMRASGAADKDFTQKLFAQPQALILGIGEYHWRSQQGMGGPDGCVTDEELRLNRPADSVYFDWVRTYIPA